jgi:hypothetical protein
LRKKLVIALATLGLVLAVPAIIHDKNVRAENEASLSMQIENDLHRPMFGDVIEAVDSPWYDVKEGSFKVNDDGVRARWNPEYSDIGSNGGRMSDENYYGLLKEGQEFKGVERVILAGSYLENDYDENGAWQGTKEMPYVGIPVKDFMRNLDDDDPLKKWLEKCGLKEDDMIFVASGKIIIDIPDVPSGSDNYHRDKRVPRI